MDFLLNYKNLKIVLEIDGKQHLSKRAKLYDQRRDAYLSQKGYKILRIRAREVFKDVHKVLIKIEKIHCKSGDI